MGGVAKTIGNTFSNPIRGLTAIGTFGTSELARKMGPIPKAIASLPETASNAILGTHYNNPSGQYSDPNSAALNLYMNPAADSAAISGLGQSQFDQSNALLDKNVGMINNQGQQQYDRTGQQITQDTAARSAARDQLAQYLQAQAQQTFKNTLPGTAEDYNSGGLLNSTGYQQEVARQQANLAAGVTNQLGIQGAQDMYSDIGARDQQLANLYGFQNQGLNAQLGGSQANLAARQSADQQALGRTFNLQDYAREANVAKQIGAQLAPSTKPTKASSTAMGLSGLGAGAQAGSLMGGPGGALAGGIGGSLLGLSGGGK